MKHAAYIWFLLPFYCWAETCLFTPPTGWQPLKPKTLSRSEIGFAKKGNGHFNPSINLAFEEVDCDLKDYLKAVKQIHLSQPNTRWSDLGTIEMKAGIGRLTEIRKPSPCGELALLQAIFLKDGKAYIITAALLKQEMISHQKEILTSLRSLELTATIWDQVKDPALKEELLTSSQWDYFKELVEQKTGELGAYWQYLALQEGNRRIYE